MPKYEITKFYYVWERVTVEAEDEDEAWEKIDELPKSAWIEYDRDWRDSNIEEAFDDDFS